MDVMHEYTQWSTVDIRQTTFACGVEDNGLAGRFTEQHTAVD